MEKKTNLRVTEKEVDDLVDEDEGTQDQIQQGQDRYMSGQPGIYHRGENIIVLCFFLECHVISC